MNTKDTFLKLGHFNVKDGSQTRFWVDTWLGNKPLKDKFPALFNIVRRKQDTIATVLSSPELNISFRRNLVGVNLLNWNRIAASLQQINLLQERDVFVWGFKASGFFTVKSMYAALINNGVRVSYDIWQMKLPMKLKVFMWYLKRGVILTKDNLGEIGLETSRVVSAISQSQFTISFLIAFMPNFCGALYIYFLEFHLPRT